MKILFLSSKNDIKAGSGNYTHGMMTAILEVNETSEEKIDFELLLPKDIERLKVKYPVKYILPKNIFTFKTWKVWKWLPYLFFRYKTDADLVHSIAEYPHNLLAQKIAKQNNIPYTLTAMGTYALKPLYDGRSFEDVNNQFEIQTLIKKTFEDLENRGIHYPKTIEEQRQILT